MVYPVFNDVRNKMASKKKVQPGKAPQVKKGETAKEEKSSFSPSSIKQFVQEVQAEFNKVVWPDRKVTTGLTGFVLILVVVISIYLGSVDLSAG